MTESKIKEHDLYAVIKDLVDEVSSLNRLNQNKICRFIFALIENGGHKTRAARAAGYGQEKGKDGTIQTELQRNNTASSEADRLLKNDKIFSIYNKMLHQRNTAEMFAKSFTSDISASIFFQIAMMTFKDNPRLSKDALREAALVCKHYQDEGVAESATNKNKKDEMVSAAPILEAIVDMLRKKPIGTIESANGAIKPTNVSDVYN